MITLQEQIDDFEEMSPKREWTLAKRDGLYLASSNPVGHVARLGRPNPEIIRNIGATPQEAFEGMALKTRRKHNVQQN